MHTSSLRWHSSAVALAAAALMAACGGGGSDGGSGSGGSSGGSGSSGGGSSTAAAISLSGTAAKGLMANADVSVHAVKADGSVDTATALASTTTDASGRYTLSFSGTQGQPYVVRVTAKAGTTHLDEVSGTAEPLPAGFAMRSLLVAGSSGTQSVSASVTPFSEMAVAAAAKASGGVTAANAQQAVSTVTQLLGFNPVSVTPTTLAAASGTEQQQMAVMLTAVAKLASDGGLGCDGAANSGAKTQCVVQALAGSASTGSIKLSSGSTDVSSALGGALVSVLADSKLSGTVSSSALATVAANLACSSNCSAAPSGSTSGPDATATAIAAAKLLFGGLKTDWTAMFSSGGATSIATGALNKQAFAFSQAMDDVRLPVDVLAKDVGALAMGIDLYNDYKAGRIAPTVTDRSRGDGSLVDSDGSVPDASTSPMGCSLYQDANTSQLATAVSNANYIGCAARYYVSRSQQNGSTVTTEWRHGFTLTPNADGSFAYSTRARQRVRSCNAQGCTVTSNAALQTDAQGQAIAAFSGTLTPTLSAAFGNITRLVIAGDLPAAFLSGSPTLDSRAHKHTLAFDGSVTRQADGSIASSAAGSLLAKDASGATVSTLTLKPSSMLQLPVSFDAQDNEVRPGTAGSTASGAHTAAGLSLNLVFANAAAEFEGLFAVSDATWDKSGTALLPTKATLSGALRTVSNGTASEFLKGVLTATASGVAAYDASAAFSASNSYSVDLAFTGTVNAPNRPTLELTLGSGWTFDTADGRAKSVALQYRSLVNGAPRSVVTLTGDRDASGNVGSLKLAEASSDLSLTWTRGASTADLMKGTTKIGTLNTATGLLTFSDGSFISLDIGL